MPGVLVAPFAKELWSPSMTYKTVPRCPEVML